MNLAGIRQLAKIVAWIDIVLKTLSMLGLFGMAIYITVLVHTSYIDKEIGSWRISSLSTYIWIVAVANSIVACIQIWAATRLLKATHPRTRTDINQSIQFCKVYCIVTGVSIVFSVIISVSMLEFKSPIVILLVNGIFLFIAYRFMQGLKESESSVDVNETTKIIK